MKYLYLSSNDSLDYYPTNNPFDFTVNLPYSLSGQFVVALAEVHYTSHEEELFIFCDLCEDSYIKDNSLPILRTVSNIGEFSNLYFHTVTRKSIQRIRIYITNKNLDKPSYDIGPVRCLLILKEI